MEINNEHIILPNVNIYNVLNDSTLGVMIGIYTGVAINMFIANQEYLLSCLFCLGSAFFLSLAIYKNHQFDSSCKSSIINDTSLQKETIENLKKTVKKQIPEVKSYIRCFWVSIVLSIALIFTGITLYVDKAQANKISTTNTQIELNRSLYDSIHVLNGRIQQQNDYLNSVVIQSEIYQNKSDIKK